MSSLAVPLPEALAEAIAERAAELVLAKLDEDDVDHPTRKGIAVRVEDLPKLREAVEALIEAASQESMAT